MRKIILLTVFCLVLFPAFGGCKENVKEPSVAGSFYPSEEKKLRGMLDEFFSRAETKKVDGQLIALIAPHAGYQYSGQVAAYAYKYLSGRDIENVILIGPSHYSGFKGASVYSRGSMRTPLGSIKINEKIASLLLNEKADVTFYPEAFEKEHSLEVQLPFLQHELKNFRIVPVLIGSPTRASFEHLTGKLTEVLRDNPKTIIIASTDLSHYHDYATAEVMDRKIISAVENMDIEDVENNLMAGIGEMCGAGPVIFAMAAARDLGATNGVLYRYANSGDVTGDKARVVGYAAMGLYKSALTKEEKAVLLRLAKETITGYVKNKKVPSAEVSSRLKANGATFVTINRNGRLRGCIGNIRPTMPLYLSVINNAVSASSKDSRFPPLREDELNDIEVEVSVLSPLEPLGKINDIEIGKHGLVIVKEGRSGLLLPQVATEFGWDRNTFLENISLKAGLPKDAWKNAKLYTFTAEVIK